MKNVDVKWQRIKATLITFCCIHRSVFLSSPGCWGCTKHYPFRKLRLRSGKKHTPHTHLNDTEEKPKEWQTCSRIPNVVRTNLPSAIRSQQQRRSCKELIMNTLTESQINLANRSHWIIPKSDVNHDRNTPSKQEGRQRQTCPLKEKIDGRLLCRIDIQWSELIRIDLLAVKRVTRL